MIQREAEQAKAIVVLWTERSVASEWVRIEAMFGKDRNKLVPLRLEPCQIPMAFSLIQAADLTGWIGERTAGEWQKALSWVRALSGASQASEHVQAANPIPERSNEAVPQKDVPLFQYDRYVFISYPRDVDPAIVRSLVRGLFRQGTPVWIFDPVPFGFRPHELQGMHYQRPGLPMEAQTPEAIKNAKCSILLLSRSTHGSRFQAKEATWVKATNQVVPLIVDDLPHEQLPEQFRDVHVMRLGAEELRSGAAEKVLSIVLNEVKVRLVGEAKPSPQMGKKRRSKIVFISVFAFVFTVVIVVSLVRLFPLLQP